MKRLSLLITAGGTREGIDSVRCITNISTGKTGAAIADRFIRAGSDVVYICGKDAAAPYHKPRLTARVESARELCGSLETMLRRESFDCVIHSMAVSDYTPRSVMTDDELVRTVTSAIEKSDGEAAAGRVRDAILNAVKGVDAERKIESGAEALFIALERAPKAIQLIKSIRPSALLVGFKLSSGSDEVAQFKAGYSLISSSGCELVVANDTSGLTDKQHRAFIMDRNGILRHATNKREIADTLYECVVERLLVKSVQAST